MYGQLKQLSVQLIRQFGMPCIILQKEIGKYDPSTGQNRVTETRVSAYCLFDNLAFDFTRKAEYSTVKQGDVLIYLTAKADVGDKVEADGESWTLVNVQPIKPAGTALLYQCQGRK